MPWSGRGVDRSSHTVPIRIELCNVHPAATNLRFVSLTQEYIQTKSRLCPSLKVLHSCRPLPPIPSGASGTQLMYHESTTVRSTSPQDHRQPAPHLRPRGPRAPSPPAPSGVFESAQNRQAMQSPTSFMHTLSHITHPRSQAAISRFLARDWLQLPCVKLRLHPPGELNSSIPFLKPL